MACCCCRYTTAGRRKKRKKEEECDTRPQIHLLPPSDHLSRSFLLLHPYNNNTHTHRVSRQSFLGSPSLATSSVAFRPSGWQHVRSAVSNRIFFPFTSSPFCFGLARKRILKDSGGNTQVPRECFFVHETRQLFLASVWLSFLVCFKNCRKRKNLVESVFLSAIDTERDQGRLQPTPYNKPHCAGQHSTKREKKIAGQREMWLVADEK